jgi:hypothetical protein
LSKKWRISVIGTGKLNAVCCSKQTRKAMRDKSNLPLDDEPQRVLDDVDAAVTLRSAN